MNTEKFTPGAITTVIYYMIGEQKQSKKFNSLEEARVFMLALSDNTNCECYGLEKRSNNPNR